MLSGLGEAIEAQFSRWNLTEAEREVALLLLKGLSLKEAAAVRATTGANDPGPCAIAVHQKPGSPDGPHSRPSSRRSVGANRRSRS